MGGGLEGNIDWVIYLFPCYQFEFFHLHSPFPLVSLSYFFTKDEHLAIGEGGERRVGEGAEWRVGGGGERRVGRGGGGGGGGCRIQV